MILSIKCTCCSDMASKESLLAGEASAMRKNSSHLPGIPQWHWTQSFQHPSLGRPKINIVLLVWCHQYWAGRHNNCPWSDGCAFPKVVQHTVCLMQNKSIFFFLCVTWYPLLPCILFSIADGSLPACINAQTGLLCPGAGLCIFPCWTSKVPWLLNLQF